MFFEDKLENTHKQNENKNQFSFINQYYDLSPVIYPCRYIYIGVV